MELINFDLTLEEAIREHFGIASGVKWKPSPWDRDKFINHLRGMWSKLALTSRNFGDLADRSRYDRVAAAVGVTALDQAVKGMVDFVELNWGRVKVRDVFKYRRLADRRQRFLGDHEDVFDFRIRQAIEKAHGAEHGISVMFRNTFFRWVSR